MKRLLCAGLVVAAFVSTSVADGHAGTDFRLRGYGARLSYVNPTGVDGALGFDLMADFGTLRPNFAVESTLDYWSSREDRGTYSVDVRDFAVGGRVKYTFDVANRKLRPYAAGGVALHFLGYSGPANINGTPVVPIDDSEAQLGLDLAGGVGYKTGDSLFVVGEVRSRLLSAVYHTVFSAGVVYWFD